MKISFHDVTPKTTECYYRPDIATLINYDRSFIFLEIQQKVKCYAYFRWQYKLNATWKTEV